MALLTAIDDTYDLSSWTMDVPAPGPLENDRRPSPDTILEIVEWPTHGRLSITPAGSFRYQPEPDFTGEDRFRYRLSGPDGTSEPATVLLRVSAILPGGPVVRDPVHDPFTVGRPKSGGDARVELGDVTSLAASLEWVVPGVALTVPGLLVLGVLLVQGAGALAWLPLIRRFRRGLTWRAGGAGASR